MTTKADLKVVPICRDNINLNDIPACLRRYAEQIEDGNICVDTLLYVRLINGKVSVGCFGNNVPRLETIGMLELGKLQIMEDYLDAKDKGEIGDPEDWL